MPQDTRRYLGFAFANADFLIETDRVGIIQFAAGAVGEFTDKPDVTGTRIEDLFEFRDGTHFAAGLRLLAPGRRTSSHLKLAKNGKAAIATLFHLPGNDGRLSCTLKLAEGFVDLAAGLKDAATGLPDREAFFADAVAKASHNDALMLVNVPALPKLCAGLPVEKADALLSAIGQSIETSGAKAAGRLSDSSFGAVADPKTGPKTQIPGIRAAMAAGGLTAVDIQETQVAMKAPALRPEQRLLALRYVVERFTGGRRGDLKSDLGQAFEAMMDETQERVRQLTDTVAAGDFALAYQPIKDLKTGALSHFEALARFTPGDTGETIQFVEKLGISDVFDLAVAMKVITALETDTNHAAHVAFNVSGHTVQSPESFAMLFGLLTRWRKLAPRLLIEVTETAEITNLTVAAKAIDSLKKMGFRVGLDDFGAGAATLNYLHAFQVDFVKFDGSLVKKLGASARDDTLLSAMLKLCTELGFDTIAECLENEDDIAKARAAGFHLGQGYALGAPGKIPYGAGREKTNAKRAGITETWQ